MDRYGNGAITLKIIVLSRFTVRDTIWTMAGDQGDAWHQGKVGFRMDAEHSIVIEATVTQ